MDSLHEKVVFYGGYWSNDPHGNVEWLCQQLRSVAGSEFAKFVRYEYDLISGKVLRVNYQENTDEQFYHRYGYDEDNRLTRVETSADGVIWEADAAYDYYRHGPLRRMELGEDRVQGVDYTYTIHGWLKAMNGQAEAPQSATQPVPADVFRMALTYYAGDYKRTGNAGGVDAALNPAPAAGKDLFNGNIAAWSRQIAPRPGGAGGQVFDGQITAEQFTYDELNRLKGSSFQSLTGVAAAAGAYQTSYGYDPNGNLLDLRRYRADGKIIDNLHYEYNWQDISNEQNLLGNRLLQVTDRSGQAKTLPIVPDADFSLYTPANAQKNNNITGTDVADQTAAQNYTYDETGNLTADAQDGINIEWTVYGKVKTVTKTDESQIINYLYDASGNRTVKTVQTRNPATNAITTVSTYYVRDAQGNVLAVYDDNGSALAQRELYLYGSSRLGIYRPGVNRAVATNGIYTRSLTRKEYELSDHLGNVRAVIGDYREADGTNPVRAALRSYANYYAFGLEMPGMNWKGGGYRYGFNGKEQDKDFANNYDYGARIYSAGVGRFLSVDPLTKQFPMLSSYQFAGNTPIMAIDLDGKEASIVIHSQWYADKIKAATSRAEVDRLVARAVEDAYGNGRPDVATFTADPNGMFGYVATSSVTKDLYIIGTDDRYKTAGDVYKYGRSQHPRPLTSMEKFASWSESLYGNYDGALTASDVPYYNADGTLGRGGQLFVGTIGVAGGIMTLPYVGTGLGARLLWGAGMASDLNGMEQAISNRQQSLGETGAEKLGGKAGKNIFYVADATVNLMGVGDGIRTMFKKGPWLLMPQINNAGIVSPTQNLLLPTKKAISSFAWAPDLQSTIDQGGKPFGYNFNWRDFKYIPAQNQTTPKQP